MALVGAVGIALSGCGNANGTSLPAGANPNGSGGGGSYVSPTGGTSTAFAPIIFDNGTAGTTAYTGFNAPATDTQSTTSYPSASSTTDPGSHSISFAGNGLPNVGFKFGGTIPSLTYVTTGTGVTLPYSSFSTISFYLGYTAAATPPGAAPSVAIELTGGSGASAYDARVGCTGTLATAPSKFTCTLPSYGAFPVGTPNAASTYTVGLVNPAATGGFTPVGSTSFYVFLVYKTGTATASTGNIAVIDTGTASP
jgi:hypothetical protein